MPLEHSVMLGLPQPRPGLQGTWYSLATHRLGFELQAPTRTKAKGREKAVLPSTDASCSNSFSRPLLARNWLPIHYLLFTILTGRGRGGVRTASPSERGGHHSQEMRATSPLAQEQG